MTDVVLQSRVQRNLENIYWYTVDRFGEAQADRYVRTIRQSCDEVLSVRRPTLREMLASVDYRFHVSGSHRIYSRVDENGDLLIVRILHSRMDLQRHLPGA